MHEESEAVVTELRAQLATCEQELGEAEAKWKRARADFENREKEIAREREEFVRFANAGFLRDFLPILDAVDAALGRSGDRDQEGVGMRALQKLCMDFLERHGAAPVGVLDQPVDYLQHEVVATRTAEGVAPGVILEVVARGYMLQGRLLRSAKVIISE